MTVAAKTVEANAPLSALHAMLPQIRRETDAHNLNRVVNDPSVYRWVKGYHLGALDMSPLVEDKSNVLLMGQHGGILFVQHMPGLYECHTQVLKEGRGQWAVDMARACLHMMFTQSDCLEVFTRAPRGNLGAKVLAKLCGFQHEFTRSAQLGGWIMDGDPIPADMMSLKVSDWMRLAPGLVERGHWFHERLESEFDRLNYVEDNHPDDETHDRFVGAAVEMALGGQPVKANILYNRWAVMSGYAPFSITNMRPLTIDIGTAVLCFQNDDFFVMKTRKLGS